MTPQTRQELINTIDTMCATASQDEKLWTKDRSMILLQFAPLTNRNNLHVSYFFTKENPEVIDESVVNSADDDDASDDDKDDKERNYVQDTSEDTRQTDLTLFLLLPPSLLREHKNDRANIEISYKLFKHLTNYVAHKHWKDDVVKVSDCHDVEVLEDQLKLFNPRPIDCIGGFIMLQVKGKLAKKRIVWHHLNMIDCMVNSFCGILNNNKRLEQVKDYHELSAAVSEIIEEKANDK